MPEQTIRIKTSDNATDISAVKIINVPNGSLTVNDIDEVTLSSAGGGAPTDAEYLVGTANATLSTERVVTNTSTVAWDLATASQAKANVPDGSITYAKIQDVSVTDRLLGRDAAGAGDVEELTVSGGVEFTGAGGIQTSAFTGDVTKTAGGTAQTIANDVVTYAKMQNISAASKLLGRGDSGAGDPEEITIGSGLSMTGTTLSSTGSGAPADAEYLVGVANGTLSAERVVTDTATVAWDLATGGQAKANVPDDSITYAKIQNVTATNRILGRSTAGAGDVEEITVGGDLSQSGSSFSVVNNAISFAKMADLATDRLIGRDTTGTGDPEALTVSGGLEFTGSGGIQRSALTGDVTASAGSNSTTIANNSVTYAKMQDISVTDRLLGRQTAGAGDPEEIVCTSFARSILDDADAAAVRTTIGAGTGDVSSNTGTSVDSEIALFNGTTGKSIKRATGTGIAKLASGVLSTVTAPSGAIVGDTDSQTLTNKTLQGAKIGYLVLSPAQITSNQNNYNPGAGTFIRISSDASRNITGWSAGTTGDLLEITNVGTQNISFLHQSASSSAANRFITEDGQTLVLAGDEKVMALYDGTTSRWRLYRPLVRSVFGRTGAVVAATNDYTWAQINKATSSLADITTRSAGDLSSGTLPDARMPALTGDVTSTVNTVATTIANNAVSYAKMQDVSAASKLLGRGDSGAGDPQEITLGTGLTMTGTTLSSSGSGAPTEAEYLVGALHGSLSAERLVTDTATVAWDLATGGQAKANVPNAAITYAKIQNVSATNRILGRSTAGAGVVEEITVGGDLTQSGSSFTIANNAVTYAKMQDVTAASRLLGRGSSGSGDPQELTLDGTLAISTTTLGVVSAPTVLGAFVTKAQITANQNNYSLGAGLNFRISSDANRNITGFAAGSDGEWKTLVNTGSFTITLTNEDSASTAANRLITGTGAKVYLYPNNSATMIYDNTTARWRLWD